jgi:hypothetical protein
MLEKQFIIGRSNAYPVNIQFHKSKDSRKVYVYANYNSIDDNHGIAFNTINTNDFSLGKQELIPYSDSTMKILYGLTPEGKKGKTIIETNYDFKLFETPNEEVILYTLLTGIAYVNPQSGNGSMNSFPYYKPYSGPIMQVYKRNDKNVFGFINRIDGEVALLLKDTILYLDVEHRSRLAYFTKDKKYNKGYNDNLLIGKYVSYDGKLLKMETIGETIPSKFEHYLSQNRLIGKNKYIIPMIESNTGLRINKFATIEVK